MSRTKQAARKTTSGKQARKQLATKSTARKTAGTVSQVGAKRTRFRPGTVALREIRHYQRTTDLILKKRPFHRLVRIIMKENSGDFRFQGKALDALQECVENYIVSLFEDSNLVAVHSGRVTVMDKDLLLVAKIRSRFTDTLTKR